MAGGKEHQEPSRKSTRSTNPKAPAAKSKKIPVRKAPAKEATSKKLPEGGVSGPVLNPVPISSVPPAQNPVHAESSKPTEIPQQTPAKKGRRKHAARRRLIEEDEEPDKDMGGDGQSKTAENVETAVAQGEQTKNDEIQGESQKDPAVVNKNQVAETEAETEADDVNGQQGQDTVEVTTEVIADAQTNDPMVVEAQNDEILNTEAQEMNLEEVPATGGNVDVESQKRTDVAAVGDAATKRTEEVQPIETNVSIDQTETSPNETVDTEELFEEVEEFVDKARKAKAAKDADKEKSKKKKASDANKKRKLTASEKGKSKRRMMIDSDEDKSDELQIGDDETSTKMDGVESKGVWFSTHALAKQWDVRQTWMVVPEKRMVEAAWNVPEVLEVVRGSGVMGTLVKPKPSVHQLVLEYVANITEAFGDKSSRNYGVVFVRGCKTVITPEVINEFFGVTDVEEIEFPTLSEIAAEITAGKVTSWEDTVSIRSNKLTTLHAILHTFCVSNWLPTKNKQVVTPAMAKLIYAVGNKKRVNIGRYIFENIAWLAIVTSPKRNVGTPSLIYELIMQQAPDVKVKSDVLSVTLLKFYADHKLFEGEHLVNVSRTGGPKGKYKSEGTSGTEKSAGSVKIPKNLAAQVVEYLKERHADARNEQNRLAKMLRGIEYPVLDDSDDEEMSEEEA